MRPNGLRAAVLACVAALSLRGQSLQITSPANGTIVHPGDTVTIEVSASGLFTAVLLEGDRHLDSPEILTAPPYRFTLTIPPSISLGTHTVSACGIIRPEHEIDSESLTLDVERRDLPIAMTTSPSALRDLHLGEQILLDVIGTYEDGSTAHLRESSQTSFASQSPAVATIDERGMVTAIAPGATHIMVDGFLAVPVTVAEPIRVISDSVTLTASQQSGFAVFMTTHPEDQRVTWSIDRHYPGTLDAEGTYTAPDAIASEQTVTITATSVADPNLSATATIRLSPQAWISLSPGWAEIHPGETQQFTATVSNIGKAGLVWSISPAGYGTITNSGLYTPPPAAAFCRKVVITATSVAKPAIHDSTTIAVSPK